MNMNKQDNKSEIMRHLQSLPNIGPAIAERLYLIGIKKPEQVLKSNPEKLYEKLKIKEGGKLDICVLYQLRGAKWNIPWWKCKNTEK